MINRWEKMSWGFIFFSPLFWTHWLAHEPVSIADLDLAVEPHRGHLLQPLEAEGVELEGGAAVFGIVENGHSVVRGAAVGRRNQQSCWNNHLGPTTTSHGNSTHQETEEVDIEGYRYRPTVQCRGCLHLRGRSRTKRQPNVSLSNQTYQ